MKLLQFLPKARLLSLFALLSASLVLKAQNRSELLPILAPFYHGVASGDPTATAVIIWTRLTITEPAATVAWRVATDTGMVNIIKNGTTTTDANSDFTVKIDVTGLTPNTTYYYEFETNNKYSLRGRTKTAPVGPVTNSRFALVSCSNYAEGYFNAYKAIKERNDIDAVIHLGDYIYEYGNGEYGNLFSLQPPTEMITLADYRLRHNYYKLDSNLLRLHQQFPFITIWDDHESANDSYKDGAENHTEGAEGAWVNRKAFSIKAYREWMPIRDNGGPAEIIYRNFQYGNLAELVFLDTRLIGRDAQLATQTPAALQDSTRRLMGATQLSWFQNRINTTTAQWKIIAQQVMMAPLTAGVVPINMDQWDGYEGERKRLYNIISPKNDVVVLTGDIHTSWANELPGPLYVTGGPGLPCTNSLGVEYVVTSVTSPGLDALGTGGPQVIMAGNPHMKYVELSSHGYGLLDITPARAQHEWYFVSTITSPVFTTSFAKGYAAATNQKCLAEVLTPSIASPDKITTMAPGNPRVNSVILPIKFLQLNATLLQQMVTLKWLTGSETGCNSYTIEKSADGNNFKPAGRVNCNAGFSYTFKDSEPLTGTAYYRIVMNGTDGSKTYSSIVKMDALKNATVNTNWYPNPTVTAATCEIVVPQNGKATLKIIDGRGTVVSTRILQLQKGQNFIQVNCSGIARGLFVYEIEMAGLKQKMHGAFIKL